MMYPPILQSNGDEDLPFIPTVVKPNPAFERLAALMEERWVEEYGLEYGVEHGPPLPRDLYGGPPVW